MFGIGEFSKLAKTTVRTLRFYDEIGLFKPSYTEKNGYRYYSTEDLQKICAILELRDAGLSPEEIKNASDSLLLKEALVKKTGEIKRNILKEQQSLLLIQKIVDSIDKGEYTMNKYQAKEVFLPEITVYYRHGVIESMDKMFDFILQAGAECRLNNPTLKCADYCFVTYEAKEYQEKNVELEYVEAVEKSGKESQNIGFKTLPPAKAVEVMHVGPYSKLHDAYAFALQWVQEKGYTVTDKIREVYVHGCWDTEDENKYLTILHIPV